MLLCWLLISSKHALAPSILSILCFKFLSGKFMSNIALPNGEIPTNVVWDLYILEVRALETDMSLTSKNRSAITYKAVLTNAKEYVLELGRSYEDSSCPLSLDIRSSCGPSFGIASLGAFLKVFRHVLIVVGKEVSMVLL